MCGQLTGWAAPIALGLMTRYPAVGSERYSREQWETNQGETPPPRWVDGAAQDSFRGPSLLCLPADSVPISCLGP